MWKDIGTEICRTKEPRGGHRGAVCCSRRDGGEMRGVIRRGGMRTLYLMGIHSDEGVVEKAVVWWQSF